MLLIPNDGRVLICPSRLEHRVIHIIVTGIKINNKQLPIPIEFEIDGFMSGQKKDQERVFTSVSYITSRNQTHLPHHVGITQP